MQPEGCLASTLHNSFAYYIGPSERQRQLSSSGSVPSPWSGGKEFHLCIKVAPDATIENRLSASSALCKGGDNRRKRAKGATSGPIFLRFVFGLFFHDRVFSTTSVASFLALFFPQERVFNNFSALFFGQTFVINNISGSFFKNRVFLSHNCNAKLSELLFSSDCGHIQSPSRLLTITATSRSCQPKDYHARPHKSSGICGCVAAKCEVSICASRKSRWQWKTLGG